MRTFLIKKSIFRLTTHHSLEQLLCHGHIPIEQRLKNVFHSNSKQTVQRNFLLLVNILTFVIRQPNNVRNSRVVALTAKPE